MTVFELVFWVSFYGFFRGFAKSVLGSDQGRNPLSFMVTLPDSLGQKAAKSLGWNKDTDQLLTETK